MKDALNENHGFMRRVGSNIRLIRVTLKLSQGEVGRRVGVTKGFISQLERGQTSTTPEMLAKIAKALGVPLFVLFEEPMRKEDLIAMRDFYLAINKGLPSVKYAHEMILKELKEKK
ncbi:MAG: helix-turn-helix domain-containing protein [Dehalococcoidia bacterium]|jgi:transcriptional regulator with XRE-family HTH domain|nr:helix-turn-helix domain-containing protein [Dehalococcoidia bacterium]